MRDFDVVHGCIHGMFITGKPEFLRPVYNVCILVRREVDTQQIGSVLVMWNSTQ
jgi:hypothetical protein